MARNDKEADALGSYLDELSRVGALSREEEQALALVVEAAHRELADAVLAHRPSLWRLVERLAAVDRGDLRPNELAVDPLSLGLGEDQLREQLSATGQRLRSLLEAPCSHEDGAERSCPACSSATATARALPLSRDALVDLFTHATAGSANSARTTTDEHWREVSRHLRAAERAKAKLAEHNLRLVVTLAKRYVGRGLALVDLIQEGNLGLLRAIDGFDPHRGFRLSTYAAWWIRQAMQHALAEQTRTIRVPRHVTEAASAVHRYSRGFHHDAGRPPTVEEIADGLGVPLARVNAAMELTPDAVSLETPLGHEDSLELGDVIADSEGPSPADVLLGKDFADRTRDALETLTPEEREVIVLRFGIGAAGSHSVEEVAALRRLGTERVRQIEARALRKLRSAKRTRSLRAYARD
jgi:RNA polymerase sigma factor (sigma-70 family)